MSSADVELHRHRCEVRQVLRWRVEHGMPWVQRWLYGHQPEGGMRVRGVGEIRGHAALDRLVADLREQWALGNRGADGDWRVAA